jgi:hypothetical protein
MLIEMLKEKTDPTPGGFSLELTDASEALLGIGPVIAADLTKNRGDAASVGGGIYNAPGGDLTFTHSRMVGNGAAQGGGIANVLGTMKLGHSILLHKYSQNAGSGVYNLGELTLRNTTLTENRGGDGHVVGGGVYNGGTLTLTNSTLVANVVDTGGGIYNAGTLFLRHTILAHNGGSQGPDLWGSVTSLGHNLVLDPSDAQGLVKTDLVNIDPRLGPLQDNGGPTLTYALKCDSPAIDAGDPEFTGPPRYDQRGDGYNRIANGVVDIGAYEVQDGECNRSAPARVGHGASRSEVEAVALLTKPGAFPTLSPSAAHSLAPALAREPAVVAADHSAVHRLEGGLFMDKQLGHTRNLVNHLEMELSNLDWLQLVEGSRSFPVPAPSRARSGAE